jgi:hypothetical protein
VTGAERGTYIDVVVIAISGLRTITYELLSHLIERSNSIISLLKSLRI